MKMYHWQRLALCGAVAAISLVLVGCGISREKYGKIKVREVSKDGKVVEEGSTRAEAESILGKGTEVQVADIKEEMKDFLEARLGPPAPGESPEPTKTRAGLPSLDDLNKKATWLRWGDSKKYVLIGIIDDRVVAKTSRIPS